MGVSSSQICVKRCQKGLGHCSRHSSLPSQAALQAWNFDTTTLPEGLATSGSAIVGGHCMWQARSRPHCL